MPKLSPVDYDPFASAAPTLTPVDHNPFVSDAPSEADQHLAHPTVDDMLRPQRKPLGGRAGAFARGATRGILPLGPAGMGASVGAEIGAMTGPFAEIGVPAGALIGGGLGYWAGQKAQRSVMDAAPKGALQAMGQDPASVKLDQQTYPVTSAISEAAPSLIAGGALQRTLTRPELADKAMMVAQPKTPSADAMDARMARFKTADVDPSSATVGGPLTQAMASFAARGPLASSARKNLADQVRQVGDAVTDLASRYGNPKTPNIAGETIQKGIERYRGDVATPGSFKAKVEDMYDKAFDPVLKGEAQAVAKSEADQAAKVGTLKGDHAAQLEDAQAAQRGEQMAAEQGMPIPADQQTPTPLPPELPDAQPTTSTTNTQSTLNDVKSSINSDALRSLIQDPKVSRILDVLQTDPASLRFSDLRQLRTWVRNAQGNPDLIQNIGKGNLQRIEGSLTEDIYANTQKFGGDAALRTLKRTDDYYRASTQRIQDALQPFVDKTSPEGAVSRLAGIASSGASADGNSLFRLKRSLQPGEFGDIQASLVQNAGQVPDGAGRMMFSPTAFVGWYSKLPELSKDILFGATGSSAKAKPAAAALRTQLDNLVSVAGDMTAAEKNAQGISHWQLGAAGTTAIYSLLHPMAILGEAAALGGEAAAAHLLTSPQALVWMNRLARAGSKGAAPVMNGLNKAARSSPVLASLYSAATQAVANSQNPAQRPAETHQTFDPSQMTDEELRAASGAPEAAADSAQPGETKAIGHVSLDPAAYPNKPLDELAPAVIHAESRGNPAAVSPKGAEGLFQAMPATQHDPGFGVAPVADNSLAEKSRVGEDYLHAMLKRYGDQQVLALMAHNWGPGNVDKWVAGGMKGGVPKETRDYVHGILGTD